MATNLNSLNPLLSLNCIVLLLYVYSLNIDLETSHRGGTRNSIHILGVHVSLNLLLPRTWSLNYVPNILDLRGIERTTPIVTN
jgi:hypothetical protein